MATEPVVRRLTVLRQGWSPKTSLAAAVEARSATSRGSAARIAGASRWLVWLLHSRTGPLAGTFSAPKTSIRKYAAHQHRRMEYQNQRAPSKIRPRKGLSFSASDSNSGDQVIAVMACPKSMGY